MKKILAIALVLIMCGFCIVSADESEYNNYDEIFEEEIISEETEEDITADDENTYESAFEDNSANDKKFRYDNEEVAQKKIKVYVNGRRILFDAEPVLINGRTMVPVRAIFEALGANVTWNNDTRTAKGVLGSTIVEISIGKDYLLKNGENVKLDSPAFLSSGRTYVPARAIAESYDCKVEWDNDTRTVTIKSK
mgnify:CR=1 FL=1